MDIVEAGKKGSCDFCGKNGTKIGTVIQSKVRLFSEGPVSHAWICVPCACEAVKLSLRSDKIEIAEGVFSYIKSLVENREQNVSKYSLPTSFQSGSPAMKSDEEIEKAINQLMTPIKI
jgi:hypothetical protein